MARFQQTLKMSISLNLRPFFRLLTSRRAPYRIILPTIRESAPEQK
jgi:hypothetical protein